ncbi:MAG: hypothetical protein IJG80_08260 [Selenomonadaceae bacterium]|nr:hypothetical protein [Selenomonadaceae bacterium]MBQ9496037.1 hypothetical protein [Selenomonadaceae bacterium]
MTPDLNIKVIDASERTTAFELYGNDLDNIFYGGAGDDFFVYQDGDGREKIHRTLRRFRKQIDAKISSKVLRPSWMTASPAHKT